MVTETGPGGGAPGHVTRMLAVLERHPTLTWLRPGQAGAAEHTATWIEASPDPRIDGTPMTACLPLGMLVDFLEARFGR